MVDYHQHLVSPAFAPIAELPQRDGAALVRELDEADIEKAVVPEVMSPDCRADVIDGQMHVQEEPSIYEIS